MKMKDLYGIFYQLDNSDDLFIVKSYSHKGCERLIKQIAANTQEYIITQDKTMIESVQGKDPVVESTSEVGRVPPIFYFLLYILLSAGITTLSLKEFNVKKKEDNGS